MPNSVLASSKHCSIAKRRPLSHTSVFSLVQSLQLTGDPRWGDTGGDLHAAYDLELGDGSGDDDVEEIREESVTGVEDGVTDDEDAPGERAIAVKVLSGKSNDDIKKCLKHFGKINRPE